jgi:phage-related protein
MAGSPFALEFYADADGGEPVREWLKNDVTADHRRSIGAAMRKILQEQGVGVCGTSFGRALGAGLFEFRLREAELLARVFCHAHGERLILLLGAYDKGTDPSERRQTREIKTARSRLEEWRRRQA